MPDLSEAQPLGLISFGGSLPRSLAATLTEAKSSFHCICFEGVTDKELHTYPHSMVPFLKVGAAFTALRNAGCEKVVFAGQIFRPNLLKIRLDSKSLKYIRLFLFARSGGDDAVLRKITKAVESEGFRLLSLKDVAPSLVAQEGQLGRHALSEAVQKDVDQGFAVLSSLGSHDIGQALVIDRGRIIAVEAAEGTDDMLLRVQKLRGGGRYPAPKRSGALIKASKPQQQLRNDMPVVGLKTIRLAIEAGLEAVAIESGRVLTADLPEMVILANQNGLAVQGVRGPERG